MQDYASQREELNHAISQTPEIRPFTFHSSASESCQQILGVLADRSGFGLEPLEPRMLLAGMPTLIDIVAGAQRIKDLQPGAVGSYPDQLNNVSGKLFFSANDGVYGIELWSSDETSSRLSVRTIGDFVFYELEQPKNFNHGFHRSHGYEHLNWRSVKL